jgi:hypothetical protein
MITETELKMKGIDDLVSMGIPPTDTAEKIWLNGYLAGQDSCAGHIGAWLEEVKVTLRLTGVKL